MRCLQKAKAVGSLHENCDKQTLAEADTAPSLLNSRLGHESEESRREASLSTGHVSQGCMLQSSHRCTSLLLQATTRCLLKAGGNEIHESMLVEFFYLNCFSLLKNPKAQVLQVEGKKTHKLIYFPSDSFSTTKNLQTEKLFFNRDKILLFKLK